MPTRLQLSLLLAAALVCLVASSARGQPAPSGAGAQGNGSSPGTLSTTEEEVIFESLIERMEITKLPKTFKTRNIFYLDYGKFAPVEVPPSDLATGPIVIHRPEVPKEPEKPKVDLMAIKRLFAPIRISSISITPTRKIAVMSYNNAQLRIHLNETILGNVKGKESQKDRVMLQYQEMPPIWLYRVRPGMQQPEVVGETSEESSTTATAAEPGGPQAAQN
ncbi:MAG: hypothetical protein HY814_04885 [Candidatus Riflebacteria bacterium]|nr:hypothetical protein [Candidatus Riflebacteria bacterium]